MNRFISLLVLFLNLTLSGQNFLDQHLGTYRGQLHLCYPNRPIDSVQFELIIQPTEKQGRWTNTVRYLSADGSVGQVKDYDLVKDSVFNDDTHFILDEKDGILITETRIGNTFYSNYTVDGMFYTVSTTFNGNYIDYELTCYPMEGKRESVSEPDEENVTWKVDSFPLMTVQKGRLYKQKTE
ncbi:MAG: hypothetical protein HYZ43_14305 [Flavobacteriia bacterium]|nr:hypothetical protein [Flavobacteriia bacterium]